MTDNTTFETTVPQPAVLNKPTRLLIEMQNGDVANVACSDLSAKIVVVDRDPVTLTDEVRTAETLFPRTRVTPVETRCFTRYEGTDAGRLLSAELVSVLAAGHDYNTQHPTRVVICLDRGSVSLIACSDPEATAIILDRDADIEDPFDITRKSFVNDAGDLIVPCSRRRELDGSQCESTERQLRTGRGTPLRPVQQRRVRSGGTLCGTVRRVSLRIPGRP